MIWFIKESYHYMNPNSLKEWLSFICRLPGNYWTFRKIMKEATGHHYDHR